MLKLVIPFCCLLVAAYAVPGNRFVEEQPLGDDSFKCQLCHEIVKVVADMSGKDKHQIISKVNGICDKLGGSLAETCKSLVDSQIDKIIDYLSHHHNVDYICEELQQCQHHHHAVQADKCGLCTTVVHAAKGKFDAGESEDQAAKELKAMCDNYGSEAALCKSLIDKQGHHVWAELKQGKTERAICGSLGLCALPSPEEVKADKCALCHTIIDAAKKKQAAGESEDQAANELKQQCNDFGALSDRCKTFIDTKGHQVWAWLKQGKSSDAVCSSLGECAMPPVDVEMITADKCALCHSLINQAKAKFDAGESEAQAAEELKHQCNAFGSLADRCKQLIDQKGNQIWSWLKQGKTEIEICKAIGECALPPVEQIQADKCFFCHQLVKEAKAKFDAGVAEPKAAEELKHHCNAFGSLADKCKQLIDEKGNQIWSWFKDGKTEAEICVALGECAPSSVEKVTADPCALCKQVVQVAKSRQDSGASEADTKAALLNLCNNYGAQAGLCKTFINNFADQVWAWLKQGKSEASICGLLGLCAPSETEAYLLQPEEGAACPFCETFIKFVGGLLAKDEPNMEKEIEKLCGNLGPLGTLCNNLADKELDKVILWLQNGENEFTICAKLKLCSAAEEPEEITFVETDVIEPERGFACPVCETIVKLVAGLLEKDEPNIEAAVANVCKNLGPLSDMCQNIADNELEKIIGWLQNGENEKQICDKLKLCSSVAEHETPIEFDVEPERGFACPVCETVVNLVAGLLEKDEPNIEAAVANVCKNLGPLSDICQNIADNELEKIIGWLQNGENEKQICDKLKLCSSVSVSEEPVPEQGFACPVCETVVKLVSGLLAKDEPNIEIKVNDLCKNLGPLSIICQNLADKELENIVQWLQNGENEKQICEKLKFCSSFTKVEVSDFEI